MWGYKTSRLLDYWERGKEDSIKKFAEELQDMRRNKTIEKFSEEVEADIKKHTQSLDDKELIAVVCLFMKDMYKSLQDSHKINQDNIYDYLSVSARPLMREFNERGYIYRYITNVIENNHDKNEMFYEKICEIIGLEYIKNREIRESLGTIEEKSLSQDQMEEKLLSLNKGFILLHDEKKDVEEGFISQVANHESAVTVVKLINKSDELYYKYFLPYKKY